MGELAVSNLGADIPLLRCSFVAPLSSLLKFTQRKNREVLTPALTASYEHLEMEERTLGISFGKRARHFLQLIPC